MDVAPESDESVPADFDEDLDDVKIPWHFWVLVGLVGLYIGWRFIQLGVNAWQNLF